MKILIASLPFPGHENQINILHRHLIYRHAVIKFSNPWIEPRTPALLNEWIRRFKKHTEYHGWPFYRDCERLKPDVVLADPCCFFATEAAVDLKIPFLRLGILPAIYLDNLPLAQFTIPEFEFVKPSKKVRFFGPLLDYHPTQGDIPPSQLRTHEFNTFSTLQTTDYKPYTKQQWQHARRLFNHAGFHTVNHAIAWGIPVTQYGKTEDKPQLSERVLHSGLHRLERARELAEICRGFSLEEFDSFLEFVVSRG